MTSAKTLGAAGLLLLLTVELYLFSGSFSKYFNHDSLFYMIHSPQSYGELREVFSKPDAARQYRPMTLALTALLKPLWGLDPYPYHWVPLLFHMMNTVLLYLLLKRLLRNAWSVWAATAFWGLHSVAGWITYDITYLSDFMMAFFFLASLILAVDGFLKRSWIRLAGAAVLFLASLLSKEAAVTYPLGLLLCLVLAERREAARRDGREGIWRSVRKALPLTGMALFFSILYAAMLYGWFQDDLLYSQGSTAAYDIDLGANLGSKTMYLFWALNLPEKLHIERPNRNRFVALVLMGGLLVIWAGHFLTRRFRLALEEWSGLMWLIGMILPALLLSGRLGKWYLYVPLAGTAFMFGILAERLRGWLDFLGPRLAGVCTAAVLFIPLLFSSNVQTRSFLVSSDSSYASDVVYNCVTDFRETHPNLPDPVLLYLLPTFEKNVADFFGGGEIYQLFYPETQIEMMFADKGHKLPQDFRTRSEILILQYLYGHVYDVTEYYKGRGSDPTLQRVVLDSDAIHSRVSREEFYHSYDYFDTPGGTPVFFPTVGKEILSQVGGSIAVIPVDEIPENSSLLFDISWMFDAGDGGWAELILAADDRETILFREYMNPNPRGKGLRWKPVRIDMSPFAHKKAKIHLKCYNNPGNTTIADWLNWRDMIWESRRGRNPLPGFPADADSRKAIGKTSTTG